eukprot:11162663-Lingulodinium_polyedra.AAC.1
MLRKLLTHHLEETQRSRAAAGGGGPKHLLEKRHASAPNGIALGRGACRIKKDLGALDIVPGSAALGQI